MIDPINAVEYTNAVDAWDFLMCRLAITSPKQARSASFLYEMFGESKMSEGVTLAIFPRQELINFGVDVMEQARADFFNVKFDTTTDRAACALGVIESMAADLQLLFEHPEVTHFIFTDK